MKEIDRLLKQWIPVNTIIRQEIREAIVKECFKSFDLGVEEGKHHKIKTNTNG